MVRVGTRGSYREVYTRFGASRIVCATCGFNRNFSDPTEDYEFWYVTDFDGHRIWAENLEHLDWLIGWLEQRPTVKAGRRDYTEGFPKWLKAAKNRDAIAERLRRLRMRE